jgi:hypothetical protein
MGSRWRRASSGAVLGAVAIVLGNPVPAHAQQSEIEALRAQIEELSQRLEKLESSQVAAAETAKATPPVSSRFPVTLSGLLQVHSLGFLNQEGPAPRATTPSACAVAKSALPLPASHHA